MTLKNREVEEILIGNGFEKIDKSKHGFEYLKRKGGKDYLVRVPNHPAKDCPKGTLGSIIRTSGKSRKEFHPQ